MVRVHARTTLKHGTDGYQDSTKRGKGTRQDSTSGVTSSGVRAPAQGTSRGHQCHYCHLQSPLSLYWRRHCHDCTVIYAVTAVLSGIVASDNVYARRTKTQTITAAARIYPDTPVLSYRPSFLLSPDRQWAAYTDRSAETAWSAPCRTGYTEPFPGTLPPPAQRSGSRRLFHRDAAPPAAAPAPGSSAGLTWRGQVRSTAEVRSGPVTC